AIDKAVSMVRSFSDEAHREDTSKRVIVKHTALAKAGRVTGGRVFGYKNHDVIIGVDVHGRPLRSHVERVVDPSEKAVVLRIFNLYDSGLGYKRIARTLNEEGAIEPLHFKRRDDPESTRMKGWCPSTVRGVLIRELYRGVMVWNKTKKKDSYGMKLPVA